MKDYIVIYQKVVIMNNNKVHQKKHSIPRHKLWSKLKRTYEEHNKLVSKENHITNEIDYTYATSKCIEKSIVEIRNKIDEIISNIEECSICFEILHDNIEFDCGHKFHDECIKKLFFKYMKDECPLCRGIFTYGLKEDEYITKTEFWNYHKHTVSPIYIQKLFLFLHKKDIHIDFITDLARFTVFSKGYEGAIYLLPSEDS